MESTGSMQQRNMFSHQSSPGQLSSTDACLTIVQSLMTHRQGRENENFAKRAIESLVKKLKERHDELDSLIMSITTKGIQQTKCVTIQRTLDGRLQGVYYVPNVQKRICIEYMKTSYTPKLNSQLTENVPKFRYHAKNRHRVKVAGKKGFPHVIYAKIWRWPDLHKNELKHQKFCTFAFDLKQDSVCVNPYHYERVIAPDLSTFNVKGANVISSRDEATGHSSGSTSSASSMDVDNVSQVQMQFSSSQSTPDKMNGRLYSSNGVLNAVETQPTPPPSPRHGTPVQQSRPPTYALPPKQRYSGMLRLASPTSQTFANYYENSRDDRNGFADRTSTPETYSSSQEESQTAWSYSPASQNNHGYWVGDVQVSNQPPPEYWCSIAYFEYDLQIGEPFSVPATTPVVTIDGYDGPSTDDRLCLGSLANLQRSDRSKRIRSRIGKGVQIEVKGEGDIWLQCLSDHPVFVQSLYLDREAGRMPGDAVHKIYASTHIKIFDLKQCHRQMQQQAITARTAALAQNAASASTTAETRSDTDPAAFNVEDLRRQCILRISFEKFPSGHVKYTSCCLEVHLFRALQVMEEVVQDKPK